MSLPRLLPALAYCFLLPPLGVSFGDERPDESSPYRERVLGDSPTAYWDFAADPREQACLGEVPLPATAVGRVQWPADGPGPERHPVFQRPHRALRLFGQRGYLAVDDPGEASPLDFDQGDELTMEAWVQLRAIDDDAQVYIVGKGRTGRPGTASENQNYALRLRGSGGKACVSFLFRSRGEQAEFHRWTTSSGFLPGSKWHHVAVCYRYGDPGSIRGFIDGQSVDGRWDLGGATEKAPVVDDDQLWIGSSMGGNPRSTFNGAVDEIAIYRRIVDAERLQQRFARISVPFDWKQPFADVAAGQVRVEVCAGVPEGAVALDEELPPPEVTFQQHAFAAIAVPRSYLPGGILGPTPNPQLLRLRGRVELPAGRWQFLVRAKSASRLWIDGQLVAETKMMKRNASGHEEVPELAEADGELAALSAGHQETRAEATLEAGEHLVQWDVCVGGANLRPELGEAYLGVRQGEDQLFRLLAAGGPEAPLTEAGRSELIDRLAQRLDRLNTLRRREAAASEADYWQMRHERAREFARQARPKAPPATEGYPAHNAVDHFLNARLATLESRPAELVGGDAFLRRLTLDLAGVIPTAEELRRFREDSAEGRRSRAIDRLLNDPRWADHWVAYWQDVLAENPGILKPKLNNTGPFRFWIHESFLDNKPLDRFVTELIEMRGGAYDGGPAGFAMATQNDVPMAAKAHVIATAFLGVEMKCARCHDAPYHPYKQRQLFGLAAFLQRKPITLPATSTVPSEPGGRQPLVEVTLEPGDSVAPQWPFDQWVTPEQAAPLVRRGGDPRQQLAALITAPQNLRFAEVAVNRLWQRYFGRGLVASLEDWHEAPTRHPELLRYLACELLSSGYDLKHVARLILNSHAYQRQLDAGRGDEELWHFAAPSRRRMSAEQLLDSLLSAAGKPMDTEPLTLDPEGRRSSSTFLNLGVPRRAWHFTSLSNERDRPALALPAAQSMIDLLIAFGWRDSRPNPLSVREQEPTVLQPLALANGLASLKATRLSDDHVVTEMALRDQPLEQLVRQVFLQILSRDPTPDELARFSRLLADGYQSRVVAGAEPRPRRRLRNPVSWSNHLNSEATRIKLELERRVRQGDPPTARLQADWRERLEDALWALVNSPEFVFVP